MFETVQHAGMTCWVDSFRKEGYGGLVLLSAFGNRNAVNAVWATLVGNTGRKRADGSVHIGDTYVRRIDDASYATIKAPLGEGLLHVILLHESATQQASMFESGFFQLGPNASERYFPRMSALCPIPLRQEWRDDVWALGLQHKLIVPLEGFGMTVHKIVTSAENWAPVIRDAILEGRLH